MIFATSISFSVYTRTELVSCQFYGDHNRIWILPGEEGKEFWVGWPCYFEVIIQASCPRVPPPLSTAHEIDGRKN